MYDVVEIDTSTVYEIVSIYEQRVQEEDDPVQVIRGHKYDIPAQYK